MKTFKNTDIIMTTNEFDNKCFKLSIEFLKNNERSNEICSWNIAMKKWMMLSSNFECFYHSDF